jgi:hypothetical protein
LLEPLLTETVKARLRSFNITLPSVVSGALPANIAQFLTQKRGTLGMVTLPLTTTRLSSVVSKSVLGTAPRPMVTQQLSSALFRSASSSAADVDFQTQVSDEFLRYIGGISRAIAGAHENWRQRAFFSGLRINGITASGGSVSGPPLSEIINLTGPLQGLWGYAAPYTRAIADGLASSWRDWEQSVRVPGLPWYPAFAAVPAPQAAPIPNVPTPMTALTWSSTALSPDAIKANISRNLSQTGPYSDELMTAVVDGFSKAITTWFSTQLVTGVLGKGAIPAYSPPYVPVGPVVMGDNIAAPGHFMA